MEKYFVPYEQALALKELGFDEPCTRYYWSDGLYSQHYNIPFNYNGKENYISVQIFSQAFEWFREKYKLDSFVKNLYKSTIKVGYYFGIDEYKGIEFQMDLDDYYETYEEAELECLKKLIEIVKEIKE